jgi:hypothetical protein
MKHNVGTWDRVLRALFGAAILAGAFMAPFSLALAQRSSAGWAPTC